MSLFIFPFSACGQVSDNVQADISSGETTALFQYAEPRWSIEARTVKSVGMIKDRAGDELSHRLNGFDVAVGYRLWKPVWIFIAAEKLKARHQSASAFLKPIHREQLSVLLKYELIAYTSSKIYLIGGVGKRWYKTKFTLQDSSLEASSTVYVAGLSGDLHIYRAFYLTGAYHIVRDAKSWDNFVLQSTDTRQEASIGLQCIF